LKCHKIPFTLNCTVVKPLKLPTIPFKTRNICQFRSLKCKKIWKIFLGTSSKYLLKIGDYLRFMHKIPLTPNCTVAKPLKLPTIPFKIRNICQFWEHFQNIFWKLANIDFFNYLLKIISFRRFSKNNLKMFPKIIFRFFFIFSWREAHSSIGRLVTSGTAWRGYQILNWA